MHYHKAITSHRSFKNDSTDYRSLVIKLLTQMISRLDCKL